MVTKPHGQPLPSHPRHHRDVWAPLVPNVLLPNLPQPLAVSPTHPSLSSPKSSSPSLQPHLFPCRDQRKLGEAKQLCGSQPREAELHPQPPDKEGWAPGTGRDERERRNGRVGLLSFGLVPVFFCRVHTQELCPAGWGQPLALQGPAWQSLTCTCLLLPVLQTINSRDPPSHCSALLLRGARFS